MESKSNMEKRVRLAKHFDGATDVYWLYGLKKIKGQWKWDLVTAFDKVVDYENYVTEHEAKGRKLQVYHADLKRGTTKKIYETGQNQEDDLPEITV